MCIVDIIETCATCLSDGIILTGKLSYTLIQEVKYQKYEAHHMNFYIIEMRQQIEFSIRMHLSSVRGVIWSQ